MNPTFTLTIMAGFDGGRIVYETVHSEEYGTIDQRLVYGGNHDEVSEYIAERVAKLDSQPAPRQIEAPVKIRVRKAKEQTPDPLAEKLEALDAFAELMEGEAD